MIGYASANGHRVRSCRLTIPRVGTWTADVVTDDEAADLSGVLSIGNLSLVGTQTRGEAWQGTTRARLVGGSGGWRRVLASRYYASTGGVRRTILARDLAQECGETLDGQPAELIVGLNYARPEQAASATLYALGLEWHVRPSGATTFAAWDSSLVGSSFDVTDYDATRDIVTIATDDPAAWVPGRTFVSPRLPPRTFTISGAIHRIEPERARVELWCLP